MSKTATSIAPLMPSTSTGKCGAMPGAQFRECVTWAKRIRDHAQRRCASNGQRVPPKARHRQESDDALVLDDFQLGARREVGLIEGWRFQLDHDTTAPARLDARAVDQGTRLRVER